MPTPAALGLADGDRSMADLKDLGWYDEDGLELLWGLAGAADPELALTSLVRLKEKLMVDFLADVYDLSPEDSYTLCSVAANLRVTQMVNGTVGMHLQMPKLATV